MQRKLNVFFKTHRRKLTDKHTPQPLTFYLLRILPSEAAAHTLCLPEFTALVAKHCFKPHLNCPVGRGSPLEGDDRKPHCDNVTLQVAENHCKMYL